MALTPLLSSILTGGQPDANGNISANNFIPSYTTTATAAGTTTLTVASTEIQRFTGSTTQTVTLPVVSTLPKLGFGYWIYNDSTGALTVNSSGGNLVATVAAGNRLWVFAILLTGTSAASWDTMPVIVTDGIKRYRALLTQASTDPPTAAVSLNTFSGSLTWTYSETGVYFLTSGDEEFTFDRTTVVIVGGAATQTYFITGSRTGSDTVTIKTGTLDTGAYLAANAVLANATVEITVYPA